MEEEEEQKLLNFWWILDGSITACEKKLIELLKDPRANEVKEYTILAKLYETAVNVFEILHPYDYNLLTEFMFQLLQNKTHFHKREFDQMNLDKKRYCPKKFVDMKTPHTKMDVYDQIKRKYNL